MLSGKHAADSARQPIQRFSSSHSVKRVAWRGHLKEVFFDDAFGSLFLHRSACVSTGDLIEFDEDGARVPCKNGKARLLPTYAAREHMSAGSLKLELLVKEITESLAAHVAGWRSAC